VPCFLHGKQRQQDQQGDRDHILFSRRDDFQTLTADSTEIAGVMTPSP
jgi:hypothetical protein